MGEGGRLSVVGCQLSVVSCQLSVVEGLKVGNKKSEAKRGGDCEGATQRRIPRHCNDYFFVN